MIRNWKIHLECKIFNLQRLRSRVKFVLLSPGMWRGMCVKLFFVDLGLCKKIVSEICKATRAEIVKTMARSSKAFKHWQQHRVENFLIFCNKKTEQNLHTWYLENWRCKWLICGRKCFILSILYIQVQKNEYRQRIQLKKL